MRARATQAGRASANPCGDFRTLALLLLKFVIDTQDEIVTQELFEAFFITKVKKSRNVGDRPTRERLSDAHGAHKH